MAVVGHVGGWLWQWLVMKVVGCGSGWSWRWLVVKIVDHLAIGCGGGCRGGSKREKCSKKSKLFYVKKV